MKPLGDKVLIKADKPEDKTKSGIYIQQDWKTIPPTGIVEAIGSDVTLVNVGDEVIFERYGSVILKDDMRLCKESHILAVINGKN